MKKSLFKWFVALMALVILCSQLPLSYIAGADVVAIQPTDYPDRTVVKLMSDIEYMAMIPSAEATAKEFIEPVDFTSSDYDSFEFDLFVAPSSAFTGTVEIAIFDDGGGFATYKIENVAKQQWIDAKIPIKDFVSDGIDFTTVIGYRINNPESWVQYKCINACLTGIQRPTEIPEGNVDFLAERIDVVDDKTNSANSDVFGFDELTSVDFLSKDWVEFDVYILDGGIEPVSVNFGVYFTDVDFDPQKSTFGKDSLYLTSIAVTSNGWNHIKIPTNNFKVGKNCTTDNITGIRLSSLKDGYRYVLANVVLKTAVVDAPAIPESSKIVASGELIQLYSLTDGSASDYKTFEAAVDLTGSEHINVDVYADSAVEGQQTLKLNIKDAAGKIAYADFDVNPGEWVNSKILIKAFEAPADFDFTQVVAVSISDLVKTTRYFLANFYLTNAVFEITNEYPYNAEKKFDEISVDFFANSASDIATESLVNFGETYNLNEYDYIEFDLFVDTPIDSTELPDTFELCVVDTNGKKLLGKRDYTYNEVQHIRILIAALYNKEEYNGDKTIINSFHLENAFADSRYIIKNFCFTKIVAPEEPTKDIYKRLLKHSDITPKYQHFYDNDVVFDGLVNDNTYNTDLDSYDITIGEEPENEYLQFDIYVVLDESSKHYAPEIGISFKMCDRPNYKTHADENGRGHASFTVKTNEWQHVRIALSSFGSQPGREKCDFNKVARYFLEGNAVGTRYVVANMCIGNREGLPEDADKPSMPEKTGVRYVTNCDSANSTNIGVWTSSKTQFTNKYKTEGKGSALLQVMNQETEAMNSHRFLFSSPADLSKSKNIKFDLLVDDIDLAATCNYTVYLSSDRRNTADNFIYSINPANLKLGWNSFNIPLSSFKEQADESADWSNIQSFCIEVILNEPFKTYGSLKEYFNLCLDNIRISDDFVLTEELNDNDDIVIEDNNSNNSISGNNGESGSIVNDVYTTITEEAEIITLDPEKNTTVITKQVIKKQKVVLDTIEQSHWIVLIVTCCVAVVLIVGSIVLVILSSRKNKLGGSK